MLVIVRSKYKTELIEVEHPHAKMEHLKSILTLCLIQFFVSLISILFCFLLFSLYFNDTPNFFTFSSVTNFFTQLTSLSAIKKYKYLKTKKQMKQLRIYCCFVAIPEIYVFFMLYPIMIVLDKLNFL